MGKMQARPLITSVQRRGGLVLAAVTVMLISMMAPAHAVAGLDSVGGVARIGGVDIAEDMAQSAASHSPNALQDLAIPHLPLTRRVKVTSQGQGFLPVRFVNDARFGATGASPHPTIELDGGGGFAGVAFVQDGVENPSALLAGRIDTLLSCATRCVPGSGGVVVRSQGILRDGESPSSAHIVPAGAYRMYVIAAAGPVTVTLTFPDQPGDQGTQELVAYTYTGIQVGLPANRAPASQRSLYYAGVSGSLSTTGMLFTYAEVIGEVSQADMIYTCYYAEAEPEGVAYLPSCPGGTADASQPSLNPNAAPAGYRITRNILRTNVDPGTYGLGAGFVSNANAIETANTVVVWLSY